MKGTEIEACRTCGIFFLTSTNLLRYLFEDEPDILLVRKELDTWNVPLNENDGFPKYICTICLLEFHRFFKFQRSVLSTQQQLQQLYNLQQENLQKIKIKSEIDENSIAVQERPTPMLSLTEEPNVCEFVYVDDLSDEENDELGEHKSDKNITPFKVPHVPIKNEFIEEAFIPQTEENVAPEMSVLALTTPTMITTTSPPADISEFQVNHDIANVSNAADGGISCPLCLHVSEDQQQHRQHLLSIHETKPVECHVCGKQFPPGTTETRLKYHIKWHRISKHIKCSLCGFYCASRDNLNEHKRAVHTKAACKICGKLLLPRKMRNHIEKHKRTESKFNCPFCATYFATNEEKNEHISLFHSSTNNYQLSFHVDPHETVVQNTTLNVLQTDSATPSNNYETSKTTVASSSTFCNEGSQYLGEESTFNSDHIDEALGENVSIDDAVDIDTTFDYDEASEKIDEDRSMQNNEMKFTCAQCPESFERLEQLISHAEFHCNNIELYECDICGKTFELKFSLNRHLKRHRNSKSTV